MRWSLLLLGLLASLLCVRPAISQSAPGPRSTSLELAVKAAFIYNFAKFTEWPEDVFADARSPIEISVMGSGPLVDLVEASVAGKQVHGRSIVVTRTSSVPPADRTCHVLVLMPDSPDEGLPDPPTAAGRPILIVTEVPDLAASGGMVNFTRRDNQIHFEINLDAIDRAGLKISSNLLRLATIVRERGDRR